MRNWAQLDEDDIVVNITVAPDDWVPPEGSRFAEYTPKTGGIAFGKKHMGNKVFEWPPGYTPPKNVPEVVTKAQAKIALLDAGLLDTVEAMMVDPSTPRPHRIAWADAQEFRRTSPTLAAMAAALNLTSDQVDDLFIAARQVEL